MDGFLYSNNDDMLFFGILGVGNIRKSQEEEEVMEVVQTITLTDEERDIVEEAFKIMDKMSDVVRNRSLHDICNWFCEYGIIWTDGFLVVPKCININEL